MYIFAYMTTDFSLCIFRLVNGNYLQLSLSWEIIGSCLIHMGNEIALSSILVETRKKRQKLKT